MIDVSTATPPPAPRAKPPAPEGPDPSAEAAEADDTKDSERSEADTSFFALLALTTGQAPTAARGLPAEGLGPGGRRLPPDGNALPPSAAAADDALDALELIPLARAASALLGGAAPVAGGTQDLLQQSLLAGTDGGRRDGSATPLLAGGASPAPAAEARSAQAGAGIAAPALSLEDPDFDQALGQRMIAMVQQGTTDARVRVHPEHLGPLEIRLKLDGDTAQVTISSPHASVRDTLEQALPRLREVFGEAGVDLAQADVNDEQSRSADAGGHGDPERADGSRADVSGAAETPDDPAVARASTGPARLLDRFA